MTDIAGSADLVALVQASTTLPIMLFSLAAGAIADNYPRRSVMLVAQLGMLVVSVALGLLTWFGHITPWLLLACTFLLGAITLGTVYLVFRYIFGGAMNIPGGVVDRVGRQGGTVEITQSDRVVVDALRPLDTPQYASPDDGDD